METSNFVFEIGNLTVPKWKEFSIDTKRNYAKIVSDKICQLEKTESMIKNKEYAIMATAYYILDMKNYI